MPLGSFLGHRSQASPEISHISGQNISESSEFLLKHSDVFCLKDAYVVLKCVLDQVDENGENVKIKRVIERWPPMYRSLAQTYLDNKQYTEALVNYSFQANWLVKYTAGNKLCQCFHQAVNQLIEAKRYEEASVYLKCLIEQDVSNRSTNHQIIIVDPLDDVVNVVDVDLADQINENLEFSCEFPIFVTKTSKETNFLFFFSSPNLRETPNR